MEEKKSNNIQVFFIYIYPPKQTNKKYNNNNKENNYEIQWTDSSNSNPFKSHGEQKNKNNKCNNPNNSYGNNSYKTYNNFLNKKRIIPKSEIDYISEIKKLMHEGGLEDTYLFIKKKKKGDKKEKNNEENKEGIISNNEKSKKKSEKIEDVPVKPIQQTQSLNEWYKILNLLPFNNYTSNVISPFPYEENNQNGIVKFIGVNNIIQNNENNYDKYFIYLREKYDFEPSINDKKIYEWKVTLLCDSYLIGVGLADKNIVIKNKNKFLSDNENFNNGVFCIINTYNKEFNIKQLRPWHCDDKNLVNHVANFPAFKKGRIITMTFNTNNQILEFKAKNVTYKMMKVFPTQNNRQNILTPCIVFYYSNDEVQFSSLSINNS